ncbi:unnamed protein product [Amoebophrya sp. A120]|nr:unnamed protein product [Amoebophrya sp. A120]|eukprot:GSA120T00020951001.1
MSDRKGCKVFVHNLPYGMHEEDVKDVFGDEAKHIVEVYVMKGYDGKPKGMASVEFKTADDAQYCIDKLDKTEVQGRRITVREDRGTGYIHPDSKGKDKGKGKRGDSRGRGKGGYGGGYGRYEERGRGRRGESRDRRRRSSGGGRSRSRGRR